jgi:hypothetical protein
MNNMKRKMVKDLRKKQQLLTYKEAIEKAQLTRLRGILSKLDFAVRIGAVPNAGLNRDGECLIDFNVLQEILENGEIDDILFPPHS